MSTGRADQWPFSASGDAAAVAAAANGTAANDAKSPPHSLITSVGLAKHNLADDAWFVIKGRVYGVTMFSYEQPGGDIVSTAAGADATDDFSTFHSSSSAIFLLRTLCLGVVKIAK